MGHVGGHVELCLLQGVVQPVLSLYVVGLALLRVEGAERGCQPRALSRAALELQRAVEGAEEVLFVSVEVHLEFVRLVHRAELRLAVFRREAVFVVGDVADHADLPGFAQLPVEVHLVVYESGRVFTLRVERSEQIFGGLVAESVLEAEAPVAVTEIGRCAEHGDLSAALPSEGLLIGDVEHRRHLVAVARLEAAGREVHALHHVGVDHREAFLLAAVDEQRAIDFHAVDIDAVLVEGAAAHVVLRRELVVGGDAGLRLYDFLDGVARDGGHALDVGQIDALRLSHLLLRLPHGDFRQIALHGQHLYVERQIAFGLHQQTSAVAVAHHAVDHPHGVGALEGEAVFAFEVGRRAGGLTFDAHQTERHRLTVLVGDASLQMHLFGQHRQRRSEQEQECLRAHTIVINEKKRPFLAHVPLFFYFC